MNDCARTGSDMVTAVNYHSSVRVQGPVAGVYDILLTLLARRRWRVKE